MKALDIKFLKDRSRSLGFCVRGQDPADGAVLAQIPDSLADAAQSVCGVKGFMVDEIREFDVENSDPVRVACAAVAALEIIDSPVHMHGETQETYTVLRGRGKMVLDDRVVAVSENSVVVLPPGVAHGLASDSDEPLKVLMTFSPGLAPKEQPDFRDEKIIHASSRERIKELGVQNEQS